MPPVRQMGCWSLRRARNERGCLIHGKRDATRAKKLRVACAKQHTGRWPATQLRPSRTVPRPSLPPDPAPVEEAAAAEQQDHDEDDEQRVCVHVLNTGSRRPITSAPL